MNKREERKLKVGFIMTGGILLTSILHSKWGFGIISSWLLGFGFIIVLWSSVKWIIRNAFGK